MYRILVVDDEPMIRMGLAKLITQTDPAMIQAETAGNGMEALEAIQTARPDFIFTDIKMPKMDGLELSKQLYEAYGDITVVVISGYGDFEYAQKCMSYGVKEYLLKPVTKSVVHNTMNKLMADRKSMQEKQRFYFPLSKLEDWLEQLELAVWHLQMNDIQMKLQEIEDYCNERRFESIQLQELLDELYAKLIKQLNGRDVYSFERMTVISGPAPGGNHHYFERFRLAVNQTVKLIREKRKGNAKEPVEEAKAYIERNLSRDLSLDEVADMLGLNPSYFSQLFKQMTDETFVHYRIKKRMEKAKKLLAIPHYKITDISFEVGYADHPHFTKTFKKVTGYTPSEYREMLGIE
ncbi:response regulator [Paenibacillus sp. JNUCC32]|uniref:response regulator transcription factor n=1 Tax=Paenibacillus sp. JNUCC32 TaxID=2777984 RepID=UPI001787BC8C|nr:response regulator [Paenibacillus sp. JNUCC-32]QOT11843.1 response regulator [Paenibacillus sp. JNUCC-32]